MIVLNAYLHAVGAGTLTLRSGDVRSGSGGKPYTVAYTPLAAGSAVGDRYVFFAGGSWGFAGMTGQLDNSSGSFWNGVAASSLLLSGDLTADAIGTNATATPAFSGGVVFDGPTGGVRTSVFSRNGSGSTSRTLTTDSSPQAGDIAFFFGSARVNAAASCNVGTLIDAANDAGPGCGVLNYLLLTSSGAVSATWTYGAGSAGDYQGIVVVRP